MWDRVEDPCLTGETFSYAIKNEAFLKKINTETQSKWAGSWFTQCGQVIEPTFQVIWINIYKLPRLSSKESPCDTGDMQQTWVPPLVGKIPLEKEVAAYSSILAGEIPWTEEPGGLQFMGSQRVGHNLVTKQQQLTMTWLGLTGICPPQPGVHCSTPPAHPSL